ncbi:phage virion morphogenesis protein [Erysipelotrichia bacterium]
MKPVQIEVDDRQVLELLARMNRRITDMREVMSGIGNEVVKGVKDNFEAEGRYSIVGEYIGGDNKWQPLSKMTERIKEKRGKSPPYKILQDDGHLAKSIHTENVTQNSVEVGTNMVYAPMHQFGAKKGEYGSIVIQIDAHKRKSKKGNEYDVSGHQRRVPNPMFNIPARPFLTVHPDNIETIVGMLTDHILEDVE